MNEMNEKQSAILPPPNGHFAHKTSKISEGDTPGPPLREGGRRFVITQIWSPTFKYLPRSMCPGPYKLQP